jgi:GTPase SAR1 family protein
MWDALTSECLQIMYVRGQVDSVAWSPDGKQLLVGSGGASMQLWKATTGKILRVFEGHTGGVRSVAWSPDGKHLLSGSIDMTLRLWDSETGECLRVFEGHTGEVTSVAWSPDSEHLLSGSIDKTLRLWDASRGHCLQAFEGHNSSVRSVAWSPDGKSALSLGANSVGRIWKLEAPILPTTDFATYTNAKVLIIGDTGVGKSGLFRYLTHGIKVSDGESLPSTDGAWASQWLLAGDDGGKEREIWLWDFAGQVDYRLVHQLFMHDVAAAVLVFNPQSENPFDGLGIWDCDIRKASSTPFAKILVAGRIDRGGLVGSITHMEKFMNERNFLGQLHHTSARTGEGCEVLRNAIINAIDWQRIPKTTSLVLFRRLKGEILKLRDSGHVLIVGTELKQQMQARLPDERFTVQDLETVASLLSGAGIVKRLEFGDVIVLQPEILSRYAAAVVRTIRKHPHELGCILESDLLSGNLDYHDFQRIPEREEQIILHALREIFVARAWCWRQACDGDVVLTFPSYYRREREHNPGHPEVLVTYRFSGPVDEIYATLVVRLHHTKAFRDTVLWRSSAEFLTQVGARLGLVLLREGEGNAQLEVYFEFAVDDNARLIFLRYVHDHLIQNAQSVVRLRHYACKNNSLSGVKPFCR